MTAATTEVVEGEALVVAAAAVMAKPMAVTKALETSRSMMHLGDNQLFPTCMATGHQPRRYLLMLLLFFNKLLHLFTREHTRLQLRTASTPWRKQPSQRRVTMLLNSCQFTRCLKQLRQMRHLNHLPKWQLEIAVAKCRTAIDVSQKAMFERIVMLICIARFAIA